MIIEFSRRVRDLSQSATMAVSTRAKEMKREGIDVIDLSAGEPDFPTPSFIKAAGVGAINDNRTKYTPAAGLDDLRGLVAEKLVRENGLEYTAENIIITAGAKQAVFNSAFCLFQEGDEVLIPSPYWVSYPEIVTISGATAVIVRGEPKKDFKISTGDLESRCTDRTRGLILNSPSNPSGAVYTPEELRQIGLFCADRGLWVISDEIYEKIIYDGDIASSIAGTCPEVRDLTVIVNGLSKTLSMTGWRIGYAAATSELVEAMIRLQSHTTSCVSSISQYAAMEALKNPDEHASALRIMVDEFAERRIFLIENLIEECGLSMVFPRGAFYLFFDVSPFFGKRGNGGKVDGSLSMCAYLLEEANVALVPGIAFGEDDYVRLSYAASLDDIKKATERIIMALKKLK